MAQWDAVVVVELVRFLLAEGRWVVVVCQALPWCRVDCVVPARHWQLVALVLARLVRLMNSGHHPLLRVLVCPSRHQSRWPCGGGWVTAVVGQDVVVRASVVGSEGRLLVRRRVAAVGLFEERFWPQR